MILSKIITLSIFLLAFIYVNCSKQNDIDVPEKIVEEKMTKLISGDDAVKIIDNLHQLDVTPEKNIVAEYGEDPKDLLYISKYSTEAKAKESLELMMSKMIEADTGPFTHIRTLPDYDKKVYISIGMGAIHYIYNSTKYVLWLQTYQDIGRELPDDLLKQYPL